MGASCCERVGHTTPYEIIQLRLDARGLSESQFLRAFRLKFFAGSRFLLCFLFY